LLSRKFSIPPQYGVGLAAVLILLMIGTGWAQTGAGQPPEVPPQTPGAPAPAFGQDNPSPQTVTNPPLSGLDEPVLEPGSDVKNYLQPGLQVSESLDTNAAGDFSNLRENGLIRVVLPLPPNIKLIDPATGVPSTETVADVWRMVPSVNNVRLTGPDGGVALACSAPAAAAGGLAAGAAALGGTGFGAAA